MLTRPEHLGQGIQQVSESIYRGVYDGVTGVVRAPVQGAEEGGLRGFISGCGKGLTGLISKPIVGILDATSKTTEGLSGLFLEQVQLTRKRIPRCFYHKLEFFRQYNLADARLLSLLKLHEKQRRNQVVFIESYEISLQGENLYLVLAFDRLYYVTRDYRVVLAIETNSIEEIKQEKPEEHPLRKVNLIIRYVAQGDDK